MAVVMVIAGFLFSAVASYMAGLVGSSNNPVSGITISTILVSALLLLGLGLKTPAGPIAAVLIGGVVCCAAAIGGDNLQDLKCGQLVGSTPWKQQVMQILGVVVAAFAMAPVLNLLNDAYHIGSKALPAPQANLMGTVAFGRVRGRPAQGDHRDRRGDRRGRDRDRQPARAQRVEDPHAGDGVRGRRLPAVRSQRVDLPRRRDLLAGHPGAGPRRGVGGAPRATSSATACSRRRASSPARRCSASPSPCRSCCRSRSPSPAASTRTSRRRRWRSS